MRKRRIVSVSKTGDMNVQATQKEGEKLAEYLSFLLQSNEAPPVWIDKENLKEIKEVRSILVVGPSSSGKTTMVNMMRAIIEHDAMRMFEIPKRLTTRPLRENEDLIENDIVTKEEFAKRIDGGLAWDRDMGDGRVERYGFPKVAHDKIAIYSANSAILEPTARIIAHSDFFAHTLIVFVNASVEVLERRMQERSPDLFRDHPREVHMRLHEVFVSPKTHVVVDHSDDSFETLERSAKLILGAVQELRT